MPARTFAWWDTRKTWFPHFPPHYVLPPIVTLITASAAVWEAPDWEFDQITTKWGLEPTHPWSLPPLDVPKDVSQAHFGQDLFLNPPWVLLQAWCFGVWWALPSASEQPELGFFHQVLTVGEKTGVSSAWSLKTVSYSPNQPFPKRDRRNVPSGRWPEEVFDRNQLLDASYKHLMLDLRDTE